MLTSNANQYLRPEYLTPLPTTLDAKKSPLALLAQTCSQIGVDPPSSKGLLAPLDKSAKAKQAAESAAREKASPSALHLHNNNNNSSSSSGSNGGADGASHQRSGSSGSTPSGGAAYSPASSESGKTTSSFKPYESCVTGREKAASSPEQPRIPSAHSSSGGSSNSRSRTPGHRRCSSNQSSQSEGSTSGRAATPQGRKSATPGHEAAAAAAAHQQQRDREQQRDSPKAAGPAPPGLPYLAYPPGLDALVSQQHAVLKSGLAAHPYLGYARVKAPAGAEGLVPVCRDPYCSGCQLSSHLLGGGAGGGAGGGGGGGGSSKGQAGPGPSGCPAGCAQCDHKAPAAQLSPAALASSPYAAYAHAQLVALAAASHLPYVCNWIAGDAAYCGKRFASSDELLQHFRSHSPGQVADGAASPQALALLSPPGLGPGHPLLARGYPTPPLSPLAAARYHPYGKPYGPGLSSLGLPLPPPPHPAALPPYFSPYSLYAGSRLGAASGMHP